MSVNIYNNNNDNIYIYIHIHIQMYIHMRVLYRYIGTWGRRYGCARAFSQPQGTNHYFIFHFVYFNSPEERDANPEDSGRGAGK